MVSASDPVARLGLWITVVLIVAKLGGDLASRLKQPAVLGELIAGIALGTIPWPPLAELRGDPYLDMLARIGVLVLLFEVGLATTVREVMAVGFASARVALLGTVGTIAAGWAATAIAVPHGSTLMHLFIAASLTATSIGVSARVLKDAGWARTREGHTILGAAVIDDVIGLVVLAVLVAADAHSVAGRGPGPWSIGWLVAKTLGFLSVALFAGVKVAPPLFRLTSRLRTGGALIATGLSLCFVLAWASNAIGLAPIVGAFTAGLILEEFHSARFVARGERPLADRMEPISSWLVPIFFVLMGMRADLRALAHPAMLLLVGVLTVAAVLGKLACALGAPRGADRMAIAAGMLPRGEVTLVFANAGLSLRLVDPSQYAALLAVVVLTSIATPPMLRWRLARHAHEAATPAPSSS